MEHFFKFLAVGGLGFIINTIGLIVGVKFGFRPSMAGPIGAELAILSNFFWNNLWTFSDKSITSWDVLPGKFLQFNLLSFGSVIIQFIFLKIGEKIFGLTKFKEPLLQNDIIEKIFTSLKLLKFVKSLPQVNRLSLYLVFYMLGVGVGLLWNFTVYALVIWK